MTRFKLQQRNTSNYNDEDKLLWEICNTERKDLCAHYSLGLEIVMESAKNSVGKRLVKDYEIVMKEEKEQIIPVQARTGTAMVESNYYSIMSPSVRDS